MTKEQVELRKRAAALFKEAEKIESQIESTLWEIPSEYIADTLSRWAEMYGLKGDTK